MPIDTVVNAALAPLGVPYCRGKPGFDGEPESYLIYGVCQTPEVYAGGAWETSYRVTITAYSPLAAPALYRRVKTAMEGAGFLFLEERDIDPDGAPPFDKNRCQQEYLYIWRLQDDE